MRRISAAAAALAAALSFAAPAAADGPCQPVTHEGQGYTVCTVTSGQDLRLFLSGPDGTPFSTFARLEETLAAEGQRLVFAMNGGMYHPDRRPVGLHVEDGAERAPLVRRAGPGNFGMLPNGVFCIADKGFAVVETLAFDAARPACRFATQSGPMLVTGGALHPRFLPDSDSRFIRNGVGVSPDGRTAYLAISDRAVTFHDFGRLFRDRLGTPEALYLDGSISRLYAPDLGRADFGRPMGPILGLVAPAGAGTAPGG